MWEVPFFFVIKLQVTALLLPVLPGVWSSCCHNLKGTNGVNNWHDAFELLKNYSERRIFRVTKYLVWKVGVAWGNGMRIGS
ncbi:hypothetical protein V6B14_18195 [Sporosarcina psychrophila]